MRKFAHVLAVAGTVLVLGACGAGGDTGGEAGGDGGATSLSMVDNEFEPADLTVSSGTELELTNEGQSPHTFTVEGQDIDQEVEAGQSSSVTIDLEPGSYDFICEFHEAQGMTGTLTVE